jgi:hypothetical protein
MIEEEHQVFHYIPTSIRDLHQLAQMSDWEVILSFAFCSIILIFTNDSHQMYKAVKIIELGLHNYS